MSGIHILMINPNDGSEIPEDVFKYNVPTEFQMGKHRLSGEVIECSLKELTGVDETFIICRICFKIMHQPTSLPCLHAFCLKCLFIAVKDYGMVCPLCMQPFDCPGRDLAQIPRSSFIYHILCVSVAGQEIDNAPCKICRLKPDEFCLTCDAYLCELCSIVCHKMNGRQDHNMMRISKYKEMITQKQPDCAIHKFVACSFCEECKILICEKCEGHKQHIMKHVDYGMAYFRKATDELLLRFPYEKSLLYKTRKESGLPLYGPTENEPNRYRHMNFTTPKCNSTRPALPGEDYEQLKSDLKNKSLSSLMSGDDSQKTLSAQPKRTPNEDTDKLLKQTAEKLNAINRPLPTKPDEMLEFMKSKLPLQEAFQLVELLHSEESPPQSAVHRQMAERFMASQSIQNSSESKKVAENSNNKITPIPIDSPEQLAELLRTSDKPLPIITDPRAFAELMQSKNHSLPPHDREKMAEMLKCGMPIPPFGDRKQLEDLLLMSTGYSRTTGEISSTKEKSVNSNSQKNEPTEAKKAGLKTGDDENKLKRAEESLNKKKLILLNHVMGRSYTTLPDQILDPYLSKKYPKIDSQNINFDDVD